MQIWIDADACPKQAKELIFRASARLSIPVCLVANRPLAVPSSPLISTVQVRSGSDVADSYIVQHAAAGDIVMFTDADLSAPMEEAERLMAALAEGADVAIGSRWLDKQRQTIHQPLYRRFFGRCFNWVTRMVMGLPFKDTQCGFKAFKRSAAQVIFRLQRIERWGFDPEILFIAQKLGYEIREVPVTWGHDERSRMSYLKDGMKMLEEMAAIRANSIAGRYDEDIAALKDTSTMVTAPSPRAKVSEGTRAHG